MNYASRLYWYCRMYYKDKLHSLARKAIKLMIVV